MPKQMILKTTTIKTFCQVSFIFMLSATVASSYRHYYVEDQCTHDETIIYEIRSTEVNSASILRAVEVGPYSSNRNCTLLLRPPEGHGIVASISEIDFFQSGFVECKDYIKIFHSAFLSPTSLCDRKMDIDETDSYFSSGEMKILYHTGYRSSFLGPKIGFELAFTAVSTDGGICSSSENFVCNNGRCVWKELTCDGHNNCGDRSDETENLCDQSRDLPISFIIYITFGSVLFLILLMACVIICCIRRRRAELGPVIAPPSSEPRVTPYQAYHPAGYFISQNPAGPHGLYPEQHPHLHHEEGGFTNPCYPNGIPQHPPPYKP